MPWVDGLWARDAAAVHRLGRGPEGKLGRGADARAIQRALDAAAGAGGGAVVLAAGEYKLDAPLVLRSGVTLRGAGPRATWLLGEHSGAVLAGPGPDVRTEGVRVADLGVYAAGAAVGIDFRWVGRSQVERVHVLEATEAGVRLGGDLTDAQENTIGTLCWSNALRDCRIADCPTCVRMDGENAYDVATANANRIEGCELVPTNDPASQALLLDGGDGNLVLGCDVGYAEAAGGVALGAGAARNVIAFNRFEAVAATGDRRAIEVRTGANRNAIWLNNYTDSVQRPRAAYADADSMSQTLHLDGLAGAFADRSAVSALNVDADHPETVFAWMDRDVAVGNPDPPREVGARLTFIFMQDDAGGRAVTWGDRYKPRTPLGAAADAVTAYTFVNAGGPGWIEV